MEIVSGQIWLSGCNGKQLEFAYNFEIATPASLMISGHSHSCYSGMYNGEYTYEGTTADGKNYYSHDTQTSWAGVLYLFFDKNCDGDTTKYLKNRWIIDDSKPSTTAPHDMDGDGECVYGAEMTNAASTTSRTPPTSAGWKVYCGNRWTPFTLTLTPICTSAPDYVYTMPFAWTTVRNGCGTRVARQRT